MCTFLADFSILKFLLLATASLTTGSVAEKPRPPPLLRIAEDVLLFAFHLGKVKFRARHSPVDVLDVIAGGLKVCCGVVRAGHKNLEKGQSESCVKTGSQVCQSTRRSSMHRTRCLKCRQSCTIIKIWSSTPNFSNLDDFGRKKKNIEFSAQWRF